MSRCECDASVLRFKKKSIQLESSQNDYLIPKQEKFQNKALDRMGGNSGKRILETGGRRVKNNDSTTNPCTGI